MYEPSAKLIERFPEGAVTPPPSKSVSHRALICAALAGGERAVRRVKNIGASDDIDATRRGIEIIRSGDNSRAIDCGESGSTLRFLIPLAGLDGREWVFRTKGRLIDRPLDIYEDIFRSRGGQLEKKALAKDAEGESASGGAYTGEIRVKGPLSPGRYEMAGNVSSQFISGMLMALPLLGEGSEIILTTPLESGDYVRLTTDVMYSFGVAVREKSDGGMAGDPEFALAADTASITGWEIPGGCAYQSVRYSVESDWSQAAFFLCAGALGRRVSVAGMSPGSVQGDMRILGILKDAGADVDAEMGLIRGRGTAVFRALAPHEGLRAVTVDATDIPDLVPPIAALACYLDGESRIENAGRLRLKESDRLEALARELGNIGADIRVEGDSLVIAGRKRLSGGNADAHGDHRIAMALSVAAIGCESPVGLTGWESVSKSYPNFWHDFEKTEKYKDGPA
ncbi:MAG: 3-phosphoshikimate 1-carboxyvinyltransferase [Clostridiales Family XIII bacterium]|jgi:3-phosphoshikimate 1-carboxyvinyltransferase|nr:3-phosphoshikimate 1-carboxyvinyltransferase [Clostridiales Family XIII bacterium]